MIERMIPHGRMNNETTIHLPNPENQSLNPLPKNLELGTWNLF